MYPQILDNSHIERLAPSVFATQPWERMSEKYKFIPTVEVLNAMRDNGFQPVQASQSRTRIIGKGEFTKHMLRFRHMDYIKPANVGEEIPEIVLVNSHDGSSAYQLMAGIFRLVCSNGMIVQSSDMGMISTRHSGNADTIGAIIEGSFSIIEDAPKNFAQIESFKQLELARPAQEAFAKAALELKSEAAAQSFDATRLLLAQRREDLPKDNGNRDLWRTMNVVQERIIRGGVRGRSPTGRRVTSKAINSVNEDIRINRALWRLTSEMAAIAA